MNPSIEQSTDPNASSTRPLRLWPGVAAAALLVVARVLVPIVMPDAQIIGFLVAVACGLLIVGWWLFFSRAPWVERIGALVLIGVAMFVTSLLVDESIRGGMMGMMLPLQGGPFAALALVVGAALGGALAARRRTAIVSAVIVACVLMTLVRTGGISGDGNSDLHWRWTPTPEERLLAQTRDELPRPVAPAVATAPAAAVRVSDPAPASATAEAPAAAPATPSTPNEAAAPATGTAAPVTRASAAAPVAWPGFRGPGRDGIVRGVRIETDWVKTPPVELWRRPVGPGWSSFAVNGNLVYTQEQRGEEEVVSCYDLETGQPVWRHKDAVRFYESNGGAGPRGTPTVHDGRVYSVGATGIVNALDARSGSLLWSRNAASDTGHEIPDWGIASSPLVLDGVVIVAVAGQLIAYDAADGKQRWVGEKGGGGYSSPHLAVIGGVPQVLLLRGARTISVSPKDGSLLWDHSWQPAVSILQPALTPAGDLLIAAGDAMGGIGIRRLAVSHVSPAAADASPAWKVEERWTSRGLKPYFNDFVVNDGHAYGFDGSILSCISLEDGERKWKGGRYGNGQLVLLPDQDVLLILSEEGDLALVSATPDKFTELAKFKAIEGKTWNHPVLAGSLLLVRNGEEMAAFRLASAAR